MAITLSEKAAEKIKGLMVSHKMPETACLRVGVRGGGCEGFTYTLDVTDKPGPHDEIFVSHGVRIVCDAAGVASIRGTEIDYDDTIIKGGFIFRNPNANKVCDCGSSFSK